MGAWTMLAAALGRARRVPRTGFTRLTTKQGPRGYYKGKGKGRNGDREGNGKGTDGSNGGPSGAGKGKRTCHWCLKSGHL